MSQKPNDHSHEVEIRVNSPSGTRRAKTGTDKRGNRYFERELIKVNDQGIETCRWHLNAGGDGGKQWASRIDAAVNARGIKHEEIGKLGNERSDQHHFDHWHSSIQDKVDEQRTQEVLLDHNPGTAEIVFEERFYHPPGSDNFVRRGKIYDLHNTTRVIREFC
mmetsp:Transcript_36525/g.96205  ORF Transcript_36525/g.96205 Transcript_36525/m.96205 type:complete len:163 (-) Transcript_36525:596-1084(-)